MQTRTKTLLAIALPAALLSSVVLAQDQQSQTPQQQSDDIHQNATARQPMSPLNSDISSATYSHLDKNRDGVVSPQEAAADPSFHTRPAATGGTAHHKTQATAEGQMQPMDESTKDQGMKDDDSMNDDSTTTDSTPTPPR